MNIQDLYKKVSSFEERLEPSTKELSHCRKGCSQCCYVNLSVFPVEANNIKNWFSALPAEIKESLKEKWKAPLKMETNFHGQKVSSCAFLHEESCTIYEARPLICRSQGLPLLFKDQEEVYVDVCPLNEELLTALGPHNMLNLDLINHILSSFEQMDAQGKERERISLVSLRDALLRDETLY